MITETFHLTLKTMLGKKSQEEKKKQATPMLLESSQTTQIFRVKFSFA